MNEVMIDALVAPPELASASRSARAAGTGVPAEVLAPAERFRRMVEGSFDFVWRSLRALGVREAAVDDAAQHVFVVASQKMADIPVGGERAFLFGTVVGVAANARRRQANEREIADEAALETALDQRLDPEEDVARREQCRILERILDDMPEDLRVVFVLFELEGLTSIEIAAMLDIPVGTAASRLRRAREDFGARVARLTAKKGGVE
jgi:RNA polymerase sigma-70 factor (ECF subfamily)